MPVAEAWALAPIGAYILLRILSDRAQRAMLERLPLRIHVNGTRGKSQTTEFITLGLQAGGMRTMGKTTGTAAAVIHPDGSRSPIVRRLPPSIREQQATVRRAVREGAEALVIECMAVRPELQWASEHGMVRSQVGVITNVRADHTDLLGRSGEEIARALSCTIPSRGILFSAEKRYADLLAAEAERRGTAFVRITDDDPANGVRAVDVPIWAHPDNLALALAVCGHLGVPRLTVLRGMLAAKGDAGRFGIVRIRTERGTVHFVNAFAANDPESTGILLERALAFLPGTEAVVALYNHRGDRSFRAAAFASFASEARFRRRYLAGDRLRGFRRLYPDAVDLSGIHGAAELWDALASEVGDGTVVFGFGNIAGVALALVKHLGRIGEPA